MLQLRACISFSIETARLRCSLHPGTLDKPRAPKGVSEAMNSGKAATRYDDIEPDEEDLEQAAAEDRLAVEAAMSEEFARFIAADASASAMRAERKAARVAAATATGNRVAATTATAVTATTGAAVPTAAPASISANVAAVGSGAASPLIIHYILKALLYSIMYKVIL